MIDAFAHIRIIGGAEQVIRQADQLRKASLQLCSCELLIVRPAEPFPGCQFQRPVDIDRMRG